VALLYAALAGCSLYGPSDATLCAGAFASPEAVRITCSCLELIEDGGLTDGFMLTLLVFVLTANLLGEADTPPPCGLGIPPPSREELFLLSDFVITACFCIGALMDFIFDSVTCFLGSVEVWKSSDLFFILILFNCGSYQLNIGKVNSRSPPTLLTCRQIYSIIFLCTVLSFFENIGNFRRWKWKYLTTTKHFMELQAQLSPHFPRSDPYTPG
jgi:hypothetical protein